MMMPHLLADLINALPPEGRMPEGGYDERDVEPEIETALLGAARVAPSADNAQIWRFICVRDAATREALAQAAPESLGTALEEAPLLLVACGVSGFLTRAKREQPFAVIDVPIAMTHLLLQAKELGLTCAWTLDCDEERVRAELEAPEGIRVIGLIALGWPG